MKGRFPAWSRSGWWGPITSHSYSKSNCSFVSFLLEGWSVLSLRQMSLSENRTLFSFEEAAEKGRSRSLSAGGGKGITAALEVKIYLKYWPREFLL